MPRLSSSKIAESPKMDVKNIIMIVVFVVIILILVYMIYKQIKKENYQRGNHGQRMLMQSPEELLLQNILKDDYATFVQKLGVNILDPKFVQSIKSLSSLNKIKYLDFQPRVATLIPTQNEIDVSKSLSYPLTNVQTAQLYLAGGNIAVAGKKIVTSGGGKYIIDGHHRWSQVYVINPSANIDSVDLSDIPDPVNALKATQLGIGANLGKIPVASVKGSNLLDPSLNQTTYKYIVDTITNDVLTLFIAAGKGSSKEQVANYIMSNVVLMQKNNQPIFGASKRDIMPQTDDATQWKDYAPRIENFAGSSTMGPMTTMGQTTTMMPMTTTWNIPTTPYISADELLRSILKDNYELFVKELGIHISDPKFVEAIKSLASKSKISFTYIQPAVGPQIINDSPYMIRGLVPTQNEIDMTKSLAFPLTSASTAELYLKGGNISVAGKKIVTSGGGKYIIDGHHRWSQVYVVNMNSNIVAMDLSDIPNPVNALKATQLGIGADLGKIKVASAPGTNLLDDKNNSQIYLYIMNTMKPEVLDVFIRYNVGTTKDEVAGYIMKNIIIMQMFNKSITGASKRDFMPQTDDAPNWKEFAPRLEGFRNSGCSSCQ